MKKFLFILLAAALALPMMSQTKADENAYRAGFRSTTKVVAHKTLKRQNINVSLRGEVPEGYASVTLAAGDVWQDGSGYQMLLDADADTYGTIIPETGPLTNGGDADASIYEKFEYKIPDNADGACSTPNIVMDNAITILIPAGVYDYVITNPTPNDRIWISTNDGSAPGRADDFEFISGATYIFTVSLGSSNDRVDLEFIDPTAPVMPENVTVDPVTGKVTWENDHDPYFNLRYREYNPNVSQTLEWNFDDYNFDGWMIYDADNDGYSWGYDDSGYYSYNGDVCLVSASWISGVGGLTPDNWLISPVVPMNGTLTIHAANGSSYYLDMFAVYAAVGEDPAIEDYVKISDDLTPEYYYNGYSEYTFDLSQFAGEYGHFAIRHYGVYDEMRLYVDGISLEVPGDEPNEWIYIYAEDTNALLENLTEGTTYEVQVQAIGEDQRTSDWTQSVIFTYEGGGEQPTERTDSPSASKVNYVEHEGDNYYNAYTVTLTPAETEPDCVIWYRIGVLEDGEYVFGPWMEYVAPFDIDEPGSYRIEAYAITEGKLESYPIADEFVVSKLTDVEEMFAGKTVANVRYFNVAGQEMQQANGMTIVVTTYTDGTTNAVKVVK